MIYEGTIENDVIDILSKRYNVINVKDEEMELEDETHFCLKITGEDVELSEVRKLVEHLDIKVIKYGHLYGFTTYN
jgi:hypothetical protein